MAKFTVKPVAKRRVVSFDTKVKRFRGPDGRFLSRSRGLKSKYARMSYLRAIRKPKVPRKPRPAPLPVPVKRPKRPHVAARRLAKARPKRKKGALPSYTRHAVLDRGTLRAVPGQFLISGIGKWSLRNLAKLILRQIQRGYHTFRFWFRVLPVEFKYWTEGKKGLASTYPLDVSIVGNTINAIMDFLHGEPDPGGKVHIIPGSRVLYYWMSNRGYFNTSMRG